MQPIDINKKYKMRKGTKIIWLKRLNDSCILACYEEPGYSAGLYYTNFGTSVILGSDGFDLSQYDLILDEEEKPVEKLDINKKYKMRGGTKIDNLFVNSDGGFLAFHRQIGETWALPYNCYGIPCFKFSHDDDMQRYELIPDDDAEPQLDKTVKQATRRILQISAAGANSRIRLFALCDDGSIYEGNSSSDKWTKLPEIPQN